MEQETQDWIKRCFDFREDRNHGLVKRKYKNNNDSENRHIKEKIKDIDKDILSNPYFVYHTNHCKDNHHNIMEEISKKENKNNDDNHIKMHEVYNNNNDKDKLLIE